MTTAQQYARAWFESSQTDEKAKDRFLAALKRRGHEKLLPRIAAAYGRLVMRQARTAPRIRIASEKDRAAAMRGAAEVLGQSAPAASVELDPKLVSGFSIEGRDVRHDASGRRALLDIYHRLTK